MAIESTTFALGAEAVQRFRAGLIESGLDLPPADSRPASGPVSYSFRTSISPKVILGFRNQDNRPAIQICSGFRVEDSARGVLRLLIYVALLKKIKTSREKKLLEQFLLRKGGQDAVFIWADGIPNLHGRKVTPSRPKRPWDVLGIGSTVRILKTEMQGTVGGFLREKGSAKSERRVFLLSAGHVFEEAKKNEPGHHVFHPHDSQDGKVVAIVERSHTPKPNLLCPSDFGLALKYREIDYDAHNIGDLGRLLGYYTNSDIREMDRLPVAKIKRPIEENLKTARVIGMIDALDFEIGYDTYTTIEDVVIMQWEIGRFSKTGDSGSLIISVNEKKAVAILISSRRAQLDGTANLSYGVSMDNILSACVDLELEVYS